MSSEGYDKNEFFETNAPLSETVQETLTAYQQVNEFEWVVETNPENSGWLLILVNVVPIVIIVGGTIFLFTKLSGSNKSSMDFGRSRARLSEDGAFRDIAMNIPTH